MGEQNEDYKLGLAIGRVAKERIKSKEYTLEEDNSIIKSQECTANPGH